MARNKNNEFIEKVMGWMVLGMLISAVGAFAAISVPAITAVVTSTAGFWIIFIAEIITIIVLLAAIEHISAKAATAGFLIYALLTGLTLAVILMMYSITAIAMAFIVAAAMFAGAAAYGYFTKRDLSTLGLVLFMVLIGVIIATLINVFVQSDGLNMIINYVVVIIFAGLTAYDLQQLKKVKARGEDRKKAAIIGALALYLNMINLFITLLEIFGDRR